MFHYNWTQSLSNLFWSYHSIWNSHYQYISLHVLSLNSEMGILKLFPDVFVEHSSVGLGTYIMYVSWLLILVLHTLCYMYRLVWASTFDQSTVNQLNECLNVLCIYVQSIQTLLVFVFVLQLCVLMRRWLLPFWKTPGKYPGNYSVLSKQLWKFVLAKWTVPWR